MAFRFGVDILPTENGQLSLGDLQNRWLIFGDLTGNAATATNAAQATNAGLAAKATAANISTAANAIAAYSNTTGSFTHITTQKGAFYATGQNAAAGFGTLGVEYGGTGGTSFAAGHAIIGNGTSGFSTKDITNITAAATLTASDNLATVNTVKNALAPINGVSQSGTAGIYAPSTAGTAGQFLKSSGSGAPGWQTFSPSVTLSEAGQTPQAITVSLFSGMSATSGNLAMGNTNVYGVVKLSDASSSTTGASAGIAATPAGVWAALQSQDAQITIGTQAKVAGQTYNIETLRSDLGLASAFVYRGTVTSLPVATASETWNDYTHGSVIIVTQGENAGVWVYNRASTAASSKWDKLGDATTYKIMQAPYNSSSVQSSGNATTFITGISQDINGVISVTKASPPTATSLLAGITTVGAAGGAAAYDHTHGNQYLPISGGTLTGMLKTKGLKGTENIDYGAVLPSSADTGQVFFQFTNSANSYELPAGGLTGQVLLKSSNSDRDVEWGEVSGIPEGGAAGQALIKNSATDGDVTWGAVGGIMQPVANTSTTFYVTGSTSTSTNTNPAVFSTSVYINNNVLHGACWNDYAEYRATIDKIEAGRCVIENGDGTLSLATGRLQAGAEIVSDTFGFAIGETDDCKTPIAVTGRVLAYPYEDINKFKPGLPVCSGPNGTVSVMSEDEARNYPWLIIGTVSAIPQEEFWGTNNVPVNGRVWIRVR